MTQYSVTSNDSEAENATSLEALIDKNIVNIKNCFQIETKTIDPSRIDLSKSKNWEKMSKFISSSSKMYSLKINNCENNVQNMVISVEDLHKKPKRKRFFSQMKEQPSSQFQLSLTIDTKQCHRFNTIPYNLDMSLKQRSSQITKIQLDPLNCFNIKRHDGLFLTHLNLESELCFQTNFQNQQIPTLKSYFKFDNNEFKFVDQIHSSYEPDIFHQLSSILHKSQSFIQTHQMKNKQSSLNKSFSITLEDYETYIQQQPKQYEYPSEMVETDLIYNQLFETPKQFEKKKKDQSTNIKSKNKEDKKKNKKAQLGKLAQDEQSINFDESLDSKIFYETKPILNLQQQKKIVQKYLNNTNTKHLNQKLLNYEDIAIRNKMIVDQAKNNEQMWFTSDSQQQQSLTNILETITFLNPITLNLSSILQQSINEYILPQISNQHMLQSIFNPQITKQSQLIVGLNSKNELYEYLSNIVKDGKINVLQAMKYGYLQNSAFITQRIACLVHYCNKKQIEIDDSFSLESK